jgi:hypothetical protein
MSEAKGARMSSRRIEHMGRDAVELSNGELLAVICARGGMVPVLSMAGESGPLNAHWIPPFRKADGARYANELHASFWKANLLYEIAGDFLCAPNFGPDCRALGAALPPHGWTANLDWRLAEASVLQGVRSRAASASFARFALESPEPSAPLSFARTDLVFEGQDALFSSTTITNRGAAPLSINVGRHATLGAPFLEPGCRLSASATRYATPSSPSEFSATGRLVEGAEFESLAAAPLRSGGVADLSLVPGMIGFTDLVAGSISHKASIGWSCVVNPRLGLAHLVLFPGMAGLPSDEIALGFNAIWMQYGGRRYTPWAESEGGPDRAFCLGSECATGAFANGLGYSLAHPELLGSATTVSIPAQASRTLNYCTALVRLKEGFGRSGPLSVDIADDGRLLLKDGRAAQETEIDASFGGLRASTR